MNIFRIVVADASRAIMLNKEGLTGSSVIASELSSAASRLHTSNIVRDQRGRVDKQSRVQSAMEPRTDPHDQAAEIFAHQVVAALDMEARSHKFDRLIVIAPGHFLGLLRAGLGKAAAKRLIRCEAKDLVRAELSELQTHIDELVRIPAPV